MPRARGGGVALRAYARLQRAATAAERHLTPAGRLFAAAALAAAVFSLDPTRTGAYLLLAALAGALAVAAVASLASRPRVLAERRLPAEAVAGVALGYEIVVTNRGRRPAVGLVLEDAPRIAWPTPAEFARERPRHTRAADAWFDRFTGFKAWQRLLEARQPAAAAPLALPAIPAGGSITVPATLRVRRRGLLTLECLRVSRTEPLALLRASRTLTRPATVLVLPPCHPVNPTAWPAPPGRHGDGVARRAARGGGTSEFLSVREYRPGDSLRHVDWRGFARRGVPVVKQFAAETSGTWRIVLDTATARPEDFEALVCAAASLLVAAPAADGATELLVLPVPSTASAGPTTGARAGLRVLAMLEAAPSPTSPAGTTRALPILPAARGVLFLTTTWDPPRRALLERWRTDGQAAWALQVADDARGDDPVQVLRPARLAADLARIAFAIPPGATRAAARA